MDESQIDLIARNLVLKDYSLEDINEIIENLTTLFLLKKTIQNIGETHCPLQDRQRRIWLVLSDLASQENCDGEPYDQMQDASEYIRVVEKIMKEDF